MGDIEAGWYPDPMKSGAMKYWDGQSWIALAPASGRGHRGSASSSSGLRILGVLLMVIAVALAVVAYISCHGTKNPLAQRDAIVMAIAAVVISVNGAALFCRR